jgi:hypothetical protein
MQSLDRYTGKKADRARLTENNLFLYKATEVFLVAFSIPPRKPPPLACKVRTANGTGKEVFICRKSAFGI